MLMHDTEEVSNNKNDDKSLDNCGKAADLTSVFQNTDNNLIQ